MKGKKAEGKIGEKAKCEASVGSSEDDDKKSSFNVFMDFVSLNEEKKPDASRILSLECYQKWVETRKAQLKQPEESFRRVLTAHVCGLIGRKPFQADIEASLLNVLRRREVWPCFRDSNVTIGIKGFRKKGFHESRQKIFENQNIKSYRSFNNNLSQSFTAPNIRMNENLLQSSKSLSFLPTSLNMNLNMSMRSDSLTSNPSNSKFSNINSLPSYPSTNSETLSLNLKPFVKGFKPFKRPYCFVDLENENIDLDPLHIFNFDSEQDAQKFHPSSNQNLAPLSSKRTRVELDNDFNNIFLKMPSQQASTL